MRLKHKHSHPSRLRILRLEPALRQFRLLCMADSKVIASQSLQYTKDSTLRHRERIDVDIFVFRIFQVLRHQHSGYSSSNLLEISRLGLIIATIEYNSFAGRQIPTQKTWTLECPIEESTNENGCPRKTRRFFRSQAFDGFLLPLSRGNEDRDLRVGSINALFGRNEALYTSGNSSIDDRGLFASGNSCNEGNDCILSLEGLEEWWC
jgi:hypothetical protein